ncbi:hypothetical protein [Streptomyces sp. NPDC088254]|uniref:hypothetical protein n=1 Tax=Streptomyces sp. NPDC088254 TaxID=3365847 RepID=UPI00381E20CB
MPSRTIDESAVVIRNFNELTSAQRVRALQIPDFLERLPRQATDRVDDTHQSVYVAYPQGAPEGEPRSPLGRITVFRRNLLAHRNPATGTGALLNGSLIEFPVTAFLDPGLWDALFEKAYEHLSEDGARVVGTYLPPECSAHTAYLTDRGFERLAESDRLTTAAYDAFQSKSYLYIRQSGQSSPRRPDAYPISPSVNLMRTANAAMALQPESAPWAAVRNYSGYSGYPWLTPLLDRLLDSPRRLLSIPAGTGDTIRLLPERILKDIDLCVGIDILDRNTRFARARHDRPHIDVLNQLLVGVFLEAKLSADAAPALSLINDVCARAGRPLAAGEAADLYVELRAAAEEALVCGGIADWFALTKGISRYLRIAPQPGLYTDESSEGRELDYCLALEEALTGEEVLELAERHSPVRLASADLLGLLRKKASSGDFVFETADMFGFRTEQPFDAMFVWEAALIVARSGRQSDFVDMVDANLASGGVIVMTGIRREDGQLGRDLEIIRDEFRGRGYTTTQTNAAPPTDRWARGYLEQPVFPVLFVTKPQ